MHPSSDSKTLFITNYGDSPLQFTIPDVVIEKWQRTVDLLAKALGSKSGRISRLLPEFFETFLTSNNADNPDQPGNRFILQPESFHWYCQKVCDSRDFLRINNSDLDKDTIGYDSPDKLTYGVRSYLGVPIQLPDGKIFGTICVEDKETKSYGEEELEILTGYKNLIEEDILYLYQQHEKVHQLIQSNRALEHVNGDLTKLSAEYEQKISALSDSNHQLKSVAQQQNEKIHQLQEILKKSSNINAHQLRGPLARILGLIHIINLEKSHSPEILNYLSKSGKELDSIIHEIQEILYQGE